MTAWWQIVMLLAAVGVGFMIRGLMELNHDRDEDEREPWRDR